ncbi:MAG: hypothetical protein C0444_01350 [Microbacterium sp.]|nr:hypothetical protein [Microbacterium sp.]MBA4346258.1 hypothetical protein [Microbacterium sp.]
MPTVTCMPRRHALAVVPLIVLVAALVGCSGETRIPPPEPSSAVEPLFSSDEEALEAATAAYEEYLAVVDALLQDPTADDSSLMTVALSNALIEASDSIATFVDRGLRFVGQRELVKVELKEVDVFHSNTQIHLYVCESVAGVDVLGPDGASVVEPTRPELTAFEVQVMASEEALRVVERVVWVDQQYCSQ